MTPPGLGQTGGQQVFGHVFISYARDDADHADRLQHALQAAGIPVWRDTADLWPGQDWKARIRSAIVGETLVFLACFSSRALARDRGYQNEELALAIEESRLRPPEQPWLIPVRFDACQIPDREIGGGRTLGSIQRADLFGRGYPEAVQRLIAAIQAVMQRHADTARDTRAPGPTGNTPAAKGVWESAYLQQVRRIAPPDPPGLIGREAELAELARFCLEPGQDHYVWWQAGPWAGKSALLSTFVLRPPRQLVGRVEIVSFFITARLAAQDTREAFTLVLLDQLADLTRQELPAVLPEARREAYLLDLLAQAARSCREDGRRLVLVVDGLDEDRSVVSGPYTHSIAALLPAYPPDEMRVIVAGRPAPPIPPDVPSWHPLRDQTIIRVLPGSPHARDLRQLGQQELQRLLHGSPLEKELLQLLTAARGGLSSHDLEELTGASRGEIEEVLHTVAGRTFTRRASQWAPETGPEVYLLGHEELQAAAVRHFGNQLADSYARLHNWATGYQAKNWPAETPEYLLNGYYRLLITLSDLPRMIAYAGDLGRQSRMLETTNGDVAALTEIRTALDFIATQDEPDLASALTLACDRDLLVDRNAHIPVGVPAVWASLGQAVRAMALATSIASPGQQGAALVGVAQALADTGQYEQAVVAARSITALDRQAEALAHVAHALACAGDAEQATAVARSATEPYWQVKALVSVARALAGGGQYEQAAAVAGAVTDPYWRAEALAQVAQALARVGEHEQAVAVARSIVGLERQAEALVGVVQALADGGWQLHAVVVAGSITGSFWQVKALAGVAQALARAGEVEQAVAVVRSVTDPDQQTEILIKVAQILATAGERERAVVVARQAEAAVLSLTSPYRRVTALVLVARILVAAGEPERAVAAAEQAGAAAHSVASLSQRAEALLQTAQALVQVGEHKQAVSLARSITDPGLAAEALVAVAQELLSVGQHDQAVAVTDFIAAPQRQVKALTVIAQALADGEERELAVAVAGRAEAVAQTLRNPPWRAEALAQIAQVLASAQQQEMATAVAGSIADPDRRAEALGQIAQALTDLGQHQQAAAAIGEAETAARSITDLDQRAKALVQLAQALADGNQRQRASMAGRQAEVLARAVVDPERREETLARIAPPLARAEQHEQAMAIARSIPTPDWRVEALLGIASALDGVVRRQQVITVLKQAEEAAVAITSKFRQRRVQDRIEQARAQLGRTQAARSPRGGTHPHRQAKAPTGKARGTSDSAEQRQQADAIEKRAEQAHLIADPFRRSLVLMETAGELADAGRYERAVTVACTITDRGYWKVALEQVAQVLARADDQPAVRRAVAALCTAAPWTVTAAPVLSLVPSAFVPLARALDNSWHTQLSADEQPSWAEPGTPRAG